MAFIDSHAHLDLTLEATSSKMSEVLGEKLACTLHISLNPFDFLKNYPILSQDKRVFFATGCYPDCTTRPDYELNSYIKALRKVLSSHHHLAVGEAGIDFKYEKYGSKQDQTALFEAQIALAEELSLPLVVHSRDTFEECYDCLKKAPKVRAVFHCFSYGVREAELLLADNHYLSFTGNLTYKNAQNIRDAAMIVPLDRLFFETDCPYLAPIPHRGQVNIPACVGLIYQYFAEMKGIDLSSLEEQVEKNFEEFFKP
ncbi:MAG: TatD family hydrolase [Brevinema sp.]